jgi:hypothetical protein
MRYLVPVSLARYVVWAALLVWLGAMALVTTEASVEVCIADFRAGSLSHINDLRIRQAVTFAFVAPFVWLLCWFLAYRTVRNGIRLVRARTNSVFGKN